MNFGRLIKDRVFSRLLGRQSELERRAFVRPRLGPDPATVFVDDALNGGQAQAVPGKLLCSMQAVQHAEEFVPALHVEADAVVAHEIDNAFLGLAPADGDECGLARCAELERVVQQVCPDLAQEHWEIGRASCRERV